MSSSAATWAGTERPIVDGDGTSPQRLSTVSATDWIPGVEPLELRIVALGDCNTSGTTHPADPNPDFCVPSQLVLQLRRAGCRNTVQNLGYPMGTTREGVTRMQLDAHAADVVLINFGLVDAWITSIPAVYVPYYPDNFVRKQSRKLLKSLKRRLRSSWARRIYPTGPVVPLPEYLGRLRQIVLLAQARQPEVCVILWGTAPALEQPERTASIERYNDSVRRLAAELSVCYVNTADLIADLDPRVAYQDQTHLGLPATERVASAMASAIRDHLALCRTLRRATA